MLKKNLKNVEDAHTKLSATITGNSSALICSKITMHLGGGA